MATRFGRWSSCSLPPFVPQRSDGFCLSDVSPTQGPLSRTVRWCSRDLTGQSLVAHLRLGIREQPTVVWQSLARSSGNLSELPLGELRPGGFRKGSCTAYLSAFGEGSSFDRGVVSSPSGRRMSPSWPVSPTAENLSRVIRLSAGSARRPGAQRRATGGLVAVRTRTGRRRPGRRELPRTPLCERRGAGPDGSRSW
jgi:hypothetical protein